MNNFSEKDAKRYPKASREFFVSNLITTCRALKYYFDQQKYKYIDLFCCYLLLFNFDIHFFLMTSMSNFNHYDVLFEVKHNK